eukprot:9621049-Heterocapsa_arctica.AAC.1
MTALYTQHHSTCCATVTLTLLCDGGRGNRSSCGRSRGRHQSSRGRSRPCQPCPCPCRPCP